MAHVPAANFNPSFLLHLLPVAVPERFRLSFEFESACVTGAGAAHATRFHNLKPTIEFSTGSLLATAALRHFGTSYHGADPGIAMAKELVMWWGWLNVRGDGLLRLDRASNAGRLAEVAASLGEAVALDLAILAFGIPPSLWTRIPETGSNSMDFIAPGQAGDIAIEAKGGHGSVVGARKKEITKQKAKQPAAEKYGVVLCYEMSGRPALKRKGSYVKIVDPPGDDSPGTSRREAIIRHYWQISTSVGLTWLRDYLASLLGPDPMQIGRAAQEQLREQCRRMLETHEPRLSVRGESYLGRYFDVQQLLAGSVPSLRPVWPTRYFFFGIAARVLRLLIEDKPEEVLSQAHHDALTFNEIRGGYFSPILITGLGDGVIRVDLLASEEYLKEEIERSG